MADLGGKRRTRAGRERPVTPPVPASPRERSASPPQVRAPPSCPERSPSSLRVCSPRLRRIGKAAPGVAPRRGRRAGARGTRAHLQPPPELRVARGARAAVSPVEARVARGVRAAVDAALVAPPPRERAPQVQRGPLWLPRCAGAPAAAQRRDSSSPSSSARRVRRGRLRERRCAGWGASTARCRARAPRRARKRDAPTRSAASRAPRRPRWTATQAAQTQRGMLHVARAPRPVPAPLRSCATPVQTPHAPPLRRAARSVAQTLLERAPRAQATARGASMMVTSAEPQGGAGSLDARTGRGGASATAGAHGLPAAAAQGGL